MSTQTVTRLEKNRHLRGGEDQKGEGKRNRKMCVCVCMCATHRAG